MMRFVLATALAMALVAGTANARPKDADVAFIQKIYDNYLAEQKDDDLAHTDSLDAIETRASASLKKALKLENRCVMKTQEVCAIDADIAINAQDWLISDVKIHALSPATEDTKTIRADFKNLERQTQVDYFFVLEDGAWKIDEIEARDFNKDGSVRPDYTWRLKHSILKRLKQFRESRNSLLHRT